jgi:hypothetical protein
MPVTKAGAYPKPVAFIAGPFVGVRDTSQPPDARTGYAYALENCYADITSGLVLGRPGFTQMGSQQGSVGARVCQWIGQFTSTGGTEATVAILNGQILTYSWGSNAWSTSVSAANFGTAGITISTTARIYAVMFNDLLIVSDGTNTPFSWNGTSGAGGLTSLTNCPVLYGQPVVYYFKLFGIKNGERDTIVWSEEGTPNTGYEAGGYNNAWTLPGTQGEPIVALAPRNDSLGILRPRSTTTITGAVNDAFKTTGTRASVSERSGTRSPASVLVLDEGTVLLDADGFPQFWFTGGGYATDPSMADGCLETVAIVPNVSLLGAETLYDPLTDLIVIGVGDTSNTHSVQYLCFRHHQSVPHYVGRFSGFPAQRMGIVKDADGSPRWVHAGVSDGYLYAHGFPGGDLWSDALNAGTQAIAHTVVTQALGYDPDTASIFDQVTWVFHNPDDIYVTVDYETSRGMSLTSQALTIAGQGGALWDVAQWDVDVWGSAMGEQRAKAGTLAHGRWVRHRVQHAQNGREFRLELVRVTGMRDGEEPEIP